MNADNDDQEYLHRALVGIHSTSTLGPGHAPLC